jgi:hypothetical protein
MSKPGTASVRYWKGCWFSSLVAMGSCSYVRSTKKGKWRTKMGDGALASFSELRIRSIHTSMNLQVKIHAIQSKTRSLQSNCLTTVFGAVLNMTKVLCSVRSKH